MERLEEPPLTTDQDSLITPPYIQNEAISRTIGYRTSRGESFHTAYKNSETTAAVESPSDLSQIEVPIPPASHAERFGGTNAGDFIANRGE